MKTMKTTEIEINVPDAKVTNAILNVDCSCKLTIEKMNKTTTEIKIKPSNAKFTNPIVMPDGTCKLTIKRVYPFVEGEDFINVMSDENCEVNFKKIKEVSKELDYLDYYYNSENAKHDYYDDEIPIEDRYLYYC